MNRGQRQHTNQQHQSRHQNQQHQQRSNTGHRRNYDNRNNNNNRGQRSHHDYETGSVDQFIPGTASLVQELDKRVLVVLRDYMDETFGRKFFGVLTSFDQFGSVVLENAVERIYMDNEYAEKKRGIFVVRGENVVFLAAVDTEKDEVPDSLEQKPWAELEKRWRNAVIAQQQQNNEDDFF